MLRRTFNKIIVGSASLLMHLKTVDANTGVTRHRKDMLYPGYVYALEWYINNRFPHNEINVVQSLVDVSVADWSISNIPLPGWHDDGEFSKFKMLGVEVKDKIVIVDFMVGFWQWRRSSIQAEDEETRFQGAHIFIPVRFRLSEYGFESRVSWSFSGRPENKDFWVG